MMDKKDLSVVLPVYCEAHGILPMTKALADAFKEVSISYEIIFIDDGSIDSTWEEIVSLSRDFPNLRALRFSRNFGKESAIAAGLHHATSDAVIVMDSDLQHPPQLIPEMVNAWLQGYLIVEGIKIQRQKENVIKHFFSRCYFYAFRTLTGMDIENASDFKLLDRIVIEEWKRLGERQLFFRGCISWLGFPSLRLGYVPSLRYGGSSKWSIYKLIKLAITSITSYSAKPLVLIWVFSILFFVLSLALMVKILFLYLQNESIPGLFTVYFLQLISGSLILFALAMISTYLQQIFTEIKNRPRYIIQDKI